MADKTAPRVMSHKVITCLSSIITSRAIRLPARALILILAAFAFDAAVFAQPQISTANNDTIIVDEAPEMEVYALGKKVIIRGVAKGVLAFGGDVIVEGRVEGDVATIGGSVIQRESAFIGGDVIVFGGAYKPESDSPLRNEGKETVMFGVFEDELRAMGQDPSQIFAPTLSAAFLAQRALSVLFWFVISIGLTTLAPGSVSRSVARIKLSGLKVVAIGMAVLVVATAGVIASFSVLPDYLSVVVGAMAFMLLLLAYVFGRVALQVVAGKLLQKRFFPGRFQSETMAILAGVVVWTIFLSIPYIWTLALLVLFAAGIGLVLTARSKGGWHMRQEL